MWINQQVEKKCLCLKLQDMQEKRIGSTELMNLQSLFSLVISYESLVWQMIARPQSRGVNYGNSWFLREPSETSIRNSARHRRYFFLSQALTLVLLREGFRVGGIHTQGRIRPKWSFDQQVVQLAMPPSADSRLSYACSQIVNHAVSRQVHNTGWTASVQCMWLNFFPSCG